MYLLCVHSVHGAYTCVGSIHGAHTHMCACHTHLYICVTCLCRVNMVVYMCGMCKHVWCICRYVVWMVCINLCGMCNLCFYTYMLWMHMICIQLCVCGMCKGNMWCIYMCVVCEGVLRSREDQSPQGLLRAILAGSDQGHMSQGLWWRSRVESQNPGA